MKIGIIGAGATGLVAAYELGKQGYEVHVFERGSDLGGQASTFDVGGARLERGYHHLFTGDRDIIDMAEEIGLGDQMWQIPSRVGTFHNGKIYDFVTPLDLLKFTPLSFGSRIRLGLVTIMIRLIKNWHKLENITAVKWLRKWTGEQAYEVFWGPMLRGKFGERHFEQVGMAWIWGKIHTRFASRGKGNAKEVLVYPIGSFGEFFDVLAEKIREQGNQIHLSASVNRIKVHNSKVAGIEVQLLGQGPKVLEFDAVVATTPSYVFPKLVPAIPRDYLLKLTSVKYMAAVLLILVITQPLSHIYWLNIADRSIPFVGVIEQTNLIPPAHYDGKHIVYLSNYLDIDDELYSMSHEELLEHYLPHLQKINSKFDRSWIETTYHHKVDAAQPIIGINYSEKIPSHRTPFERVYLANTSQVYPEDRGTNYSVRMGKIVAGMVISDLENNAWIDLE